MLLSSSRDGRISWAARRDYADATAAVLAGDGHAGATYELAGDTADTLRDLAVEVSRQSGQPVRYESVSEDEHTAALWAGGLPEPWVQMTVQPEAHGIADGLLFDESHTLSRLIGRPTTPLRSAVAEALRGCTAAT